MKHFIAFSTILLAEMVRKEGENSNTKNSCSQKALKDVRPQSRAYERNEHQDSRGTTAVCDCDFGWILLFLSVI